MSRELKDELLNSDQNAPVGKPNEQSPQSGSAANGIQIQMSDDLQDTLVQLILEDYETAKRARDERTYGTTSRGIKLTFSEWRKQLLDLYNAERIPKTTPWKFCSNRTLRIAKAIVDMLCARLFPSIVNEYLLKFRAENVASYPKVERVDKLMHWWEFVHCRVRQFFDDWVKINVAFGDCITESSWSAIPMDMGHTEQIPVTGPDGQPVMDPTTMQPSMISQRKIDLIEKTVSKIYTRDKFFLQDGSMDINREPVILIDEFFYRDLEEGEMKGQFINVSNLLREKLPFSKEMYSGLTPDEQEKIKDIKLRNQKVKLIKWYGNFDADGDGFAEDIRVYVSEEYRIFLGAIPMTSITKSGKRPIDFTKIESRLENVEENFGYGVLETVKELAEEIDAIFNQMSDAHTMMIMMPGFYDPGGDLSAPDLNLSPNRIQPVSDPQRNLYFPQMSPQTEKLINAIRLVIEFIERLTAASSYVMGKESEVVGGSGTATRTNAIVSAANERFGMPAERLRAGAANIVKQHLDLLQLNIPPGLEERILQDDGAPLFSPNELSQEGISGEFDCYLLPDPSAGSKEAEQQIAQMLYQILMQNPIVATDPTKIYRLTADVIRAIGKDPQYYLGPEPNMDMVDDPVQENTLILQGDWDRVNAQFQENHMMHIKKHSDLMQSPSLAQLPPHLIQEVMQYTQQHIQQHMQMQQMLMQLMQKGGPKGVSGAQPGSQGTTAGLQGSGGERGMESPSGPLGKSLEAKRSGESNSGQGR